MAEATWGELLNQAKGQLDLVPDGDYDVKIIDAQATNASTGARMFKVKVEIVSGPSDIAGNDRNPSVFQRALGALFLIETQRGQLRPGSMALEAFVREDRADVAVEFDGGGQ